MLRIGLAVSIGFAIGAAAVLFVSLSIDGRSAREDELAEKLQAAEGRLAEGATLAQDIKSSLEISRKLDAEVTAGLRKQIADAKADLAKAQEALNVKEQKAEKRLPFSADEGLEAIKTEYAVAANPKNQGTWTVAGAKVHIATSKNDDGGLKSFALVAGPEDVAECARSFFLVLHQVDEAALDREPNLAEWLKQSLEFAAKANGNTAFKHFRGFRVNVAYVNRGTGESKIQFVLLAFVPDAT